MYPTGPFVQSVLSTGLSLLEQCSPPTMAPLALSIAVNNVPFHVHPDAVGRLPPAFLPQPSIQDMVLAHDLVPLTIFDAGSCGIHEAVLENKIADYLDRDDVFNRGFLYATYLRLPDLDVNMTLPDNITSAIPEIAYLHPVGASVLDVPAGPYLLSPSTGDLLVPYKLYSDTQGSFHQGVVPSSNSRDGSTRFEPLRSANPGSSAMTIAVPSRLYYSPTPEKPLAGIRLGVKDLYDIAGLKTGAGSRAHYELYPEANTTAPAVQRLIDAGAVVVGKMKTSQFAAPENARDAVDYQAPFNPRGDGYQEPGSSSSGPGTGIAAYEWLDLALGSDTGGSIRVPAENNGVFGNRPSHGLVELTGAVPLAPQFDTAGFLVRDVEMWRTACKVLYSGMESGNYTRYPKQILTFDLPNPDLDPAALSATSRIIATFIQRLSRHISATVMAYNYTTHWASTHPSDTPSDIQDLLGTTWAVLTARESIRLVKEPFFADFAAAHDGRTPFVNPSTTGSWTWAGTLLPPDQNFEQAVANKTVFGDWWNNIALPPNPETCSESLFLYRFNDPDTPAYRDTYAPAALGASPDLPGVLLGFNTGFISPMAGNPDFVVPLGQVPYHSRVTGREEVLPVSVRIMAARGCDLMLLDLVNDLVREGVVVGKVRTGDRML